MKKENSEEKKQTDKELKIDKMNNKTFEEFSLV